MYPNVRWDEEDLIEWQVVKPGGNVNCGKKKDFKHHAEQFTEPRKPPKPNRTQLNNSHSFPANDSMYTQGDASEAIFVSPRMIAFNTSTGLHTNWICNSNNVLTQDFTHKVFLFFVYTNTNNLPLLGHNCCKIHLFSRNDSSKDIPKTVYKSFLQSIPVFLYNKWKILLSTYQCGICAHPITNPL
jgi:hypothetical protein